MRTAVQLLLYVTREQVENLEIHKGVEDSMTAKVMFVVARRSDINRTRCRGEWAGEKHRRIVEAVPGLRKWVLNHVVSEEGKSLPDGIGELWFDDADALETAMSSSEMGSAIEDAKRFLDMDKTYAVLVEEEPVLG